MTKEKPQVTQEVTTKVLDLYYAYFGYEYSETSEEVVKKMLDDPDIYSAWESRKNCIQAREWKIRSVNRNETLEKEIELRFAGLNISKIIGEILDSKIYGRAFHELTWKEPFDWKYDKLIKEPMQCFKLNKDGQWVFTSGKELPDKKFIIALNAADKQNPYGKSLFRPLLQTFERKTLSYTSINNFIKRFYDIIMWYVYDNTQEVDEIKAQAEAIRKIKGQDLIGLPASNSDNRGLGKDFGFITMDNFSSDTQQTMIRLCVQEIEMVIKGASFAKAGDTAGSYSKDSVSNEVRNDIIESDVKYLRDILQQLIEIDAYYFDYDPNLFYFSFIKGEDKLKQAEIEQAEQNAKLTEAEKLQAIKSLGFDIDVNYLSERFDIPATALKKTQVLEFEEENDFLLKKKEYTRELSNNFHTQIEDEKDFFIKNLKKQIDESIIGEDGEIKIDLVFPERFSELLILSNMYGMLNVDVGNKFSEEFEDEKFNPFKMKFQEAIKFFTDKVPVIYEKMEQITAKFINQNFWVKKIADLELTKKVKSSLDNAIKNGKTLDQWKKGINLKDLSDWYLDTVFRTNLSSAYSAGRYEQQMEVRGIFKYWLFDAVMDNRTSEICFSLDGKIYRSDNPIWSKIYPPLHFGCRSDVIALSDYDLRVMKIRQTEIDKYDVQNSEIYKNFVEKSTFANNPFDINYENLYNSKRLL